MAPSGGRGRRTGCSVPQAILARSPSRVRLALASASGVSTGCGTTMPQPVQTGPDHGSLSRSCRHVMRACAHTGQAGAGLRLQGRDQPGQDLGERCRRVDRRVLAPCDPVAAPGAPVPVVEAVSSAVPRASPACGARRTPPRNRARPPARSPALPARASAAPGRAPGPRGPSRAGRTDGPRSPDARTVRSVPGICAASTAAVPDRSADRGPVSPDSGNRPWRRHLRRSYSVARTSASSSGRTPARIGSIQRPFRPRNEMTARHAPGCGDSEKVTDVHLTGGSYRR